MSFNSQDVLLQTRDLQAFYGDAQALFGIDLEIGQGEAVAIIGANGAGKSTLLKALSGLVRVPSVQVHWKGRAVGGRAPSEIVRMGLALVPEGRRLFPSLSVQENLLMGRESDRSGPWNLERLFKLFPILWEKRHQPSTSLSGGQQQMVAIGRALMSNPELLLCDELSLGLAPIVVREIYNALPEITSEGMAVVLVEQDVSLAQRMTKRLYCLQEGRISLQGISSDLTRAQIRQAYFGL
jgi:branched-chain amino acid transport system ATP-binding protein